MNLLNIALEDEAVLRAIDNALQVLTQPRELLAGIAEKLEANVQQRFDDKVDPTGVPWAPLSPATVEIYESEWFKAQNPEFEGGIPGSLLVRTLNGLRKSLAFNVGPDWVELGTTRQSRNGRWQVGLLHEWGTVKMPRRGLLVANPKTGELGADDQADVLAIVDRLLGDGFA